MGENKMKMMDCVEVMVEKYSYAKEGVHKGMQGLSGKRSQKTAVGSSSFLNVEIRKILQTSTWKKRI